MWRVHGCGAATCRECGGRRATAAGREVPRAARPRTAGATRFFLPAPEYGRELMYLAFVKD